MTFEPGIIVSLLQLLAIIVLVPFITRISGNFDKLSAKIDALSESVHRDFVRWEHLEKFTDRRHDGK